MLFLRAFSRALKILRSHGGVRFPVLMSSALSRAERAEMGRTALGDGGMVGGSRTGGGSISTALIVGVSGSGGDGEGVEAVDGGPGVI